MTRDRDFGHQPGSGLPGCPPRRTSGEQPVKNHHTPGPCATEMSTDVSQPLLTILPQTITLSTRDQLLQVWFLTQRRLPRCCSRSAGGAGSPVSCSMSSHRGRSGGPGGWCVNLLPEPGRDIKYSGKETRQYAPDCVGFKLDADPPEYWFGPGLWWRHLGKKSGVFMVKFKNISLCW